MWSPETLDPAGPRYLAVADAIARDVESGRLAAGARLPPQRELAARLGVDPTTVTRAYTEARRRGLIAGHVGRGTFVRGAADEDAAADAESGGVVDLSLNYPPRATSAAAAAAMAETLRGMRGGDLLEELLQYQPHAGRASHRAAGAAWIRRRGLDADPARVSVCSGGQHAVVVLLTTLLRPGDRIACEELTYPGFRGIAELLGVPVVPLPLDAEGIRPEAFDEACWSGGVRALYTVPTAQNPTTATMSAARRRQIAEIAREHEVRIVEDDIYGVLPTDAPPALVSFAPELGYFVSSLSKALAPGLRIAYLLAPTEREAERLLATIRLTTWMAPPLTAEVAARWIADGTADRLLASNRGAARERQALAARILAPYAPMAQPEAFHLWLPLPPPWDATGFALQARLRGVVVSPASAFALRGAPVPAAVRLSLSAPASTATLQRALEILASLLAAGPTEGVPVL